MKKIFFYILLSSLFFITGCTSDYDLLEGERIEKTNFPKHSEELGKAVAKELNAMVKNLNAMGVDYSNMDNSEESIAIFYKDLHKANPSMPKDKSLYDPFNISSQEFYNMWSNFTDIQIEFIERIIREYTESSSDEAYIIKLISINKDIYSSVPKIEQERLLNLTAILYYGLSEIHNLEKQGQLPQTSYSGLKYPRLRSGSENGNGTGSCRVENASAWTYIVGAIIWTGETVVSAATIAGSSLLAFTLCFFTGDTRPIDYCIKKATECYDNNVIADWICTDCLTYCRGTGTGEWQCPRPR